METKKYQPRAKILLSEDRDGRVVIDEVIDGIPMSESIIQKSRLRESTNGQEFLWLCAQGYAQVFKYLKNIKLGEYEVVNGRTLNYATKNEVPSIKVDARTYSDINFAMLNIYLGIKNLEAQAA